MRKTTVLVLVALMAVAVACSDRSPTSPMLASAASSEASDASNPRPVARTRNVALVPARAEKFLPPGVWGSAEASLSIGPSSSTLEILSLPHSPTGACFGKYGNLGSEIPVGQFFISETFTQLIGAYPGRIVYAARYTGTATGNTITVTVTVPALDQVFGPFVLVRGVTNSWTPCQYP